MYAHKIIVLFGSDSFLSKHYVGGRERGSPPRYLLSFEAFFT